MTVSRRQVGRWAWLALWAVLVVLGICLGLWQWERADAKRMWQAAYESAPQLIEPSDPPPFGARLTVTGTYLGDHTLFLDNRIYSGQLGVAVLTPLRGKDGRLWLVERGFLATGTERSDPDITTPMGNVTVNGRWQPADDQGLLLGVNQEGKRLQQINLDAFGLSFAHDGWLHLQQAQGQDLERAPGHLASWWKPSVMSPARHVGYAFQWWGLSLVALIFMFIGCRHVGKTSSKEVKTQQSEDSNDRKKPR